MFAAATAKDFQTLMLCRFFAGVFASCPLAVVGGAFSDLFGNETRGIAIAGFSALVFIGPFISPIVGAFITQISWVEMDGVYHWYNGCARTHFGSTAVGGNVHENHIAEEGSKYQERDGEFRNPPCF